MRKYELTEETIEIDGHTLYRIKAVKDFNFIKSGDLGGFIEKEENLSHDGNCWVYDDACVYEYAFVSDNAKICDNACIFEYAHVYGEAKVNDDSKIYGESEVYDEAEIYGDSNIYGHSEVYGDAEVYNKDISGYMDISGNVSI